MTNLTNEELSILITSLGRTLGENGLSNHKKETESLQTKLIHELITNILYATTTTNA